MRGEHILLLVLAGAVGGAGLMKVVQKHQPVTVAQVQEQWPVRQTFVQPAPVSAPQPVTPPAPAVSAPEPPPKQATVPPPARDLPPVSRSRYRTAAPSHPQLARVPSFNAKPSPFVAQRAVPEMAQAVPPAPAQTAPQTAAPVEAPKPAPPQEVQMPAPTSMPPARVEPELVTPAPPPQPPTVTLNAGMLIPVRLVDGLSSDRNASGDTFSATLYRELVADGFVIAERGARVQGRVISSSRGTRMKGGAALSLELTAIHTSDGQQVAIQTDRFDKQMEPDHSQDAEKVAGGAILGAAIGAIAGGGKGAAAGAGVGAGAGAGDVMLTRKAATLPSETRLTFRLRAPVTLTERQ